MKKTSVISVRISDIEKDILYVESELQGITINALVGKIISKHIKWDRFSKEMDNVFIGKSLLRDLFENIEDDEMIELGSTKSISTIRDAILFSKGSLTLENFLSVFDMWLDTSNISFRHIAENQFDKYIIKHELGKNFSKYIKMIVETTLNEIDFIFNGITSDDHHMTFEIQKSIGANSGKK